MNRRTFLGLTLACLALTGASCSNAFFPKSKALDAHTTVTLKDAWLFGASNRLLRAKFVFEGSDPNEMYNLKAALRADEKGEDIKSIYVWYVGLTPYSSMPTNRVEMVWEFKDFPTNTPSIYLREYYLDKATGRVAKSLDFVLPGTKNLRLRDAGCSDDDQSPAKPAVELHEYSVSLAAVKIPDQTLKQLQLPPFEEIHLATNDQKLAEYVEAHPTDFSIAAITGNCVPVVWNNGQTHVKLLLDPKQEQKDFETLGVMTKGFDVWIRVGDETSPGQVSCDWSCYCGIHLKEPVGGSTDHGVGGVGLLGVITVGQTYLRPLIHGVKTPLFG